jgi:hypothetical protein
MFAARPETLNGADETQIRLLHVVACADAPSSVRSAICRERMADITPNRVEFGKAAKERLRETTTRQARPRRGLYEKFAVVVDRLPATRCCIRRRTRERLPGSIRHEGAARRNHFDVLQEAAEIWSDVARWNVDLRTGRNADRVTPTS